MMKNISIIETKDGYDDEINSERDDALSKKSQKGISTLSEGIETKNNIKMMWVM